MDTVRRIQSGDNLSGAWLTFRDAAETADRSLDVRPCAFKVKVLTREASYPASDCGMQALGFSGPTEVHLQVIAPRVPGVRD